MGKLTLVPRNVANGVKMVQRKNLRLTPVSAPVTVKMPTFGFASELQKATGAEENRVLGRFAGQL